MGQRVLGGLELVEQATPSAPATGIIEWYIGTDHVVHTIDSNGVVGGPKGFVNHGAVASTPRPRGYVSIEWYGSVAPTNAVAGDTWVDTSS
jgi:hypothetical protein